MWADCGVEAVLPPLISPADPNCLSASARGERYVSKNWTGGSARIPLGERTEFYLWEQ